MLTASSQEIQGNLYGDRHPFAYPLEYTLDSVRRDMGETLADDAPWREETLGISPWEAMESWFTSPLGQHQANQAARFAMFHADLRLPRVLHVPHDSPEADAARHEMLDIMALKDGSNLHPIGHAAVYFADMADALQRTDLLHEPGLGAHVIDRLIARQQAVHHDQPEVLHPGIVLACGGAIGDIATGGKSEADMRLEREILEHLLESRYGNAYTPDQQDSLVRFIRHETDTMTPAEKAYHVLAEAVHDIGHRKTAVATLDNIWETHAPEWALITGLRLAHAVERRTTPKLRQAVEELPLIRHYIELQAKPLSNVVNGTWSWHRASGRPVTSNHYFKLWDAALARAL